MRQFACGLARFLKSEDGPTAVGYAVVLALVLVLCIIAVTALGSGASNSFANSALNTAAGSGMPADPAAPGDGAAQGMPADPAAPGGDAEPPNSRERAGGAVAKRAAGAARAHHSSHFVK